MFAATLVGIEAPRRGAAFDLKPYLTSSLTSDLTAVPRIVNEGAADVGFDAKYAVTQNLAADLTYNTDFAQVEADQQQINLTRFSLFFLRRGFGMDLRIGDGVQSVAGQLYPDSPRHQERASVLL